jgi:organic radical activating enzyme
VKQARLIITFACPRTCAGCANSYKSLIDQAKRIPIDKLDYFKNFDAVMLTGGEPMLSPDRTIKIAKLIHKAAPSAKIYLYTALHKNDSDLESVLPYVDGVQFSLHKEANEQDIADFQAFQTVASRWKDKSFRLYIDPSLKDKIHFIPSVWKRTTSTWYSEDELLSWRSQSHGLPQDEELFVLTSKSESESPKPIKEILKISPGQKEKLKDFYISFKSQVEALRKNGKIPAKEFLRVARSFGEKNLSAIPGIILLVSFDYDYTSTDLGGIVVARDYPNLQAIKINMAKYATGEKISDPKEQEIYGTIAIKDIDWPEFLNTLVHEYGHFLQGMEKSKLKSYDTLQTPRLSYFRDPYEQQAWALGWLESMKEKLNTADPREILQVLRQYGVMDDITLRDLKKTHPKAWKGIMKQAIMSAVSDLKDTGKLPWQTDRKLP